MLPARYDDDDDCKSIFLNIFTAETNVYLMLENSVLKI